jgi:hypothetical protein
MARGGRRPGAGKPKGYKHANTLAKEELRRQLAERVARDFEALTDAQIQLALGVRHTFRRDVNGRWVHLIDPQEIQEALNSGADGDVYWIYAKPPSIRAFAYLTDQAIGKAPQAVTLAGESNRPVNYVLTWELPQP